LLTTFCIYENTLLFWNILTCKWNISPGKPKSSFLSLILVHSNLVVCKTNGPIILLRNIQDIQNVKTFKLFDFLIFRLWVYLMKVITEMCYMHYFIYLQTVLAEKKHNLWSRMFNQTQNYYTFLLWYFKGNEFLELDITRLDRSCIWFSCKYFLSCSLLHTVLVRFCSTAGSMIPCIHVLFQPIFAAIF
jgi:hypothetical protein